VANSSRFKAGSRGPAKPKLFGSETPRVFTPPLRELTPDTSLGFSVIQFATDVLEIDLFPWQKWLLVHALELRTDDSLRFRNVVVLVARQNGKSTLSQVLALWFIYMYGFKLVLGTAQDLDTAEEVWQGAVDLVLETDENDEPVRPDLHDALKRVVLNNGKKSLDIVPPLLPGNKVARYKVKAANRRAGRGLSGDLILLDELREHQTWDAWGAITKTTMARANAQVWALSNAGDASSIVLRYLRKMAHAALGDPDGINADDPPDIPDDEDDAYALDDDDSLGLFEWSAAPGCDKRDRDGWAQANPSVGHNPEFTERTITSACRTDKEWVFRTECLCQWSDGTLDGPFPAGSWESGLDHDSEIADESQIAACLDLSWNRSTAHIAVAGDRADGRPHVEVVASRAGTDWVVPWFTDETKPHRKEWPIVVQVGSPAWSLADDLRSAELNVVEWKGNDVGAACGAFYDLVAPPPPDEDDDTEQAPSGLRHVAQPLLDLAASTAATRPLQDAWAWDRKRSPHDAAPLVAVTGALWGLSTFEQPQETEVWGFWE
jgi:hypothetical protein